MKLENWVISLFCLFLVSCSSSPKKEPATAESFAELLTQTDVRFPASVPSNEPRKTQLKKEKLAMDLISLLELKNEVRKSIHHVVKAQLRASQTLKKYETPYKQFIAEEFSPDVMNDFLKETLVSFFKLEELKKIVNYFKTKTGSKYISFTTTFSTIFPKFFEDRLKKNRDKLKRKFKDHTEVID